MSKLDKDRMKARVTKKTFNVSEETRDFYKDEFGSVRSGCIFVLESLGIFFREASREIDETINASERKQILYEIERLMGSDFPADGDAACLATQNRSKLHSKVCALTAFQRVVLEFEGFSRTNRKADQSQQNIIVAIELSSDSLDFLEKVLPDTKAYAAMITVAELFPTWYKKGLEELDKELLERVKSVFLAYELPNAVAPGSIVTSVAKARLSSADQETIAMLPLFSRFCLELYAFNPAHTMNKDKKVVSTKISSHKADEFYGMFEGKLPSFFATLLVDTFPLLYFESVARSKNYFTDREMELLSLALLPYSLDSGPAVGELIIPAVFTLFDTHVGLTEGVSGEKLINKLEELSLFDRVCLEIYGKFDPRKNGGKVE